MGGGFLKWAEKAISGSSQKDTEGFRHEEKKFYISGSAFFLKGESFIAEAIHT